MVVISFPAAELTCILHERTGEPSISTVQAPHWPSPQPYLVPVSSSFSRNTLSRVFSGETSTLRSAPLTNKVKAIASPHRPYAASSSGSGIEDGGSLAGKLSSMVLSRVSSFVLSLWLFLLGW